MELMRKDINAVREFWESNPLFVGESIYGSGTKDFFEEHRRIVIDDCLAGKFDERVLPDAMNQEKVLDLGCGPGFWTIELALRGCKNIVAVDLTMNALELTRKRCELYGVKAKFSEQNAEILAFKDACFSHVNCQGVIHHTPDTEACIREIARVLCPGGTANISVYYQNIFLRTWSLLSGLGGLFSKMGFKFSGRGREDIYVLKDVDEIVRFYDGKYNPIGKAYTRREFMRMLEPYFYIKEMYLHFFPARTFPFKLPKWIHKIFDRYAGFLIYATLAKR